MGEVLEITEPTVSDPKIPMTLPIEFQASSKDHTGKDVSEQISWDSDKDGSLGKGKKIRPYLSEGNHTVTASIIVNKKNLRKEISLVVIYEDKPPLTVRSLIELCWGISINFSHDKNQRDLGETIKKKVMEIFTSYQNTKLDKDKKITYQPTPKTKMFFDNVILSMIKTVRNIGFSRNNHQNSLHALSTEYKNTEKYYNDLASFASIKDSGIAPKLLSFLGGGGFISTITDFGEELFPKQDVESIDALNTTIQKIVALNDTIAQQASNHLSNIAESTPQFPALGILSFIIFGAISLATFNVLSIVYKNYKLKKVKDEILCKQKKYYIKQYRRNMALLLINFHNDIEKLAKRFYGKHHHESIDDSELGGIVIEQDEYEWMYEGTRYQNSWQSEGDNEKTYPAHHDDEKCLKDEKILYGNERKKTYKLAVNTSNLTEAEKLWYFISYKVLPTWFTPMHPEQENA